MAKKRKLPFWLGLVLAMVLATLILMLTMLPEPKQPASPPRIMQPIKQATVHTLPSKTDAPKPMKPVVKAASAPTVLPTAGGTPVVTHGLALILDDVGYSLTDLRRVLALSVPVAISVLPDAPYAKRAAQLAHQAGQVVMLHLPMQPEDPSLQMDAMFLMQGMPRDALRDTFLRDLAQVPYVEGVNNHMGSKLTQLEAPMRLVMRLCRQKGLFFVDSKTSSHSVAARVAKNTGLQWASRQVFLDHIMTTEAMEKAWQKARTCVRRGHRCIIIAHPRAASVAFLETHLTKDDAGMMVSIKQLLRSSPPQPRVIQQGVHIPESQ